jgi:hypothetical protein
MEIVVVGVRRLGQGVALALAGAGSAAVAMGGHFDVDDASVLAPGRCQVEVWTVRGDSLRSVHLGPACRAGPLEIGVNLDRLSEGERADRIAGIQLKAATSSLRDVNVGLVVAGSRDAMTGVDLLTAYVPVTWALTGAFHLDGNLGVDRLSDRARTARLGLAGEWAFDDRFTLLAERLRAFAWITTRLGLRVELGEQASIDLSAARVSGSGSRFWGLGLNFEFGR